MGTEITNKEATDLVIPTGSWGAEGTSKADILIPRILLMQGQSKMVSNDKIAAQLGELRGSLDGKMLGSRTKPLQVIPFYFQNSWVHFEFKNGKYEFVNISPRTADNEGMPWEEERDGKKLKNTKAINVFVLIPSEVDAGEFLPYVMSFQSTSFAAGRKLVTLVEKLKAFNMAPASKIFQLGVSTKTNEKGTWFVFDTVEQVGPSKPEHLKAAYQWYQTVRRGAVKVDDSHLDDAEPVVESDKF